MTGLNRRPLRLASLMLCCSLVALTLPLGTPVAAQETAASINIPSRPLARALADFGVATGWRVAYTFTLPSGATSQPVFAAASPEQALAQMLSGTGIGYRVTGPGAVVLTAPAEAADAGGVVPDGSVMLGTIVINGTTAGAGFQGAPDWVYETPGSISVISSEAIAADPPRKTSDLFSGVPGVYALTNPQNPGVNVNIRGVQDQTRVNMMVDGVRQTFQQSGHDATAYAFVDASMISMVEVEKSTTSGLGGAASLSGQVNFRTLSADDLIAAGANTGGKFALSTGTNAYSFSGNAAFGWRLNDRLSFVTAISHKKLGDYEIGQSGTVLNFSGTGAEDAPDFSSLDTWSVLLKTEYEASPDLKFSFSTLGYRGEFGTGTVDYPDSSTLTNISHRAGFRWNPDDPLADLSGSLWYNSVHNDEYRPARPYYGAFDVDYRLNTAGLDLQNISRFAVMGGELALNYGVEAFRDRTTTVSIGENTGDDPNDVWFSGTTPGGERKVVSAFLNGSLELPTGWTVGAGLRRDSYDVSGTASVGNPITGAWDEAKVSSSGHRILPSLSASWQVHDGFQLFAGYSEGYRPPTIMETVLGGHIGINSGIFAPNPHVNRRAKLTP